MVDKDTSRGVFESLLNLRLDSFFVDGNLVVYTVAEHSGRLVVSGFQRHNHKQGMRKYLEIMPNDQISILLRYVQKGCSSIQQDPSNGAV